MTDKKIDEVILFIGEEGKTFEELQREYGNNEAAPIVRELTSTASTPYPLVHEKNGRYVLDIEGLNRLNRIQKELQWQARWEKTDKDNRRILIISIIGAAGTVLPLLYHGMLVLMRMLGFSDSD